MNINDVAMIEYKGAWFTVTGFDYIMQRWIVLARIEVDDEYMYKQACIGDANVLQYMDRAGNQEWMVSYEQR